MAAFELCCSLRCRVHHALAWAVSSRLVINLTSLSAELGRGVQHPRIEILVARLVHAVVLPGRIALHLEARGRYGVALSIGTSS